MRGHSVITRLVLILSAPLTAVSLSACSYAPPQVLPASPDTTPPSQLKGINSVAGAGSDLRILMIHGMGTDEGDACALSDLMVHLGKVLGTTHQQIKGETVGACTDGLSVPKPISISVPNATLQAELYNYHFTDAGRRRNVQMSFLLWANLTAPLQNDLKEVDHPHRSALAAYSKRFFQTHLSQVILYGGTYRQVMRLAVEQGLCYFVGGIPDNSGHSCSPLRGVTQEEWSKRQDVPTVVITHSLGGYMLMDAVADLRQAHYQHENPPPGAHAAPQVDTDDAAGLLLRRADLVFMLANQLPLLDLTTIPSYPPPPPGSPSTGAGTASPEGSGVLQPFLRHWDFAHTVHGGGESIRQVVAISDPNDLLSYIVSRGDVPVAADTKIANVYLGVTADWLSLFASPVAAHTNYLTDLDVMDILACGMAGNAILRCSP